MSSQISALQKYRAAYQPKLPKALRAGTIAIQVGAATEPPLDRDAIRNSFPNTYGQPLVKLVEGDGNLKSGALKVGVVLSGGQAPGGHNVIAGLYDALIAANPASVLYGFLKGPGGVIRGEYVELTAEIIGDYRNTGGFSMIMSGRDKIEKAKDLAHCKENFDSMGLDGLVVIGGDDSNTNAAVLAEYIKASGCTTSIIGVPKTIDGDMKNEQIEASFGFDTAARTYSAMIGDIARDAQSAVKYWHFIRLMGRAASHVTLECALQVQPNVCIVSEEIHEKKISLDQIVDRIVDTIVARSEAGKQYGILLVPEGLLEFIGDIKVMIEELSHLLGTDEAHIKSLSDYADRSAFITGKLSAHSADVYKSLPATIQGVLLERDSHGNVPLSQVETERLLMDLVATKIKLLQSQGKAQKVKFNALGHFFGYEGRCATPSNFDADYCYSLGYAAAQLVRAGLTGYTSNVANLTKSSDEWVAGGTPVTMMLNMEQRKGKATPVIKKALVDLDGAPFKYFAANRESWAVEDAYVFPGAIQYFGPSEVCDAPTKTLALEKGV